MTRSGRGQKRDLRSGRPLWLAKGDPDVGAGRLDASQTADVVIVGGGVSGALVADALLRSGLTVLAIDRRGFVKGSTPASTALVQFEIDQPLTMLSEAIGEAKAARAYWRSASAVDYLRGRIADLELRCGFRERQTVYLPGNLLDEKALAAEATARMRIGLRSRFAGAGETRALTTIDAPCSIVSAGCAELDPAQFVAGLWRSAVRRGARLFAPVEATEVEESRSGVTIATKDGPELSGRFAVFATGYELMPFVPADKHAIKSTWAIATAPQPDRIWPGRALIWEAAEPYLYMRSTMDGRIVAGGEDEDFSDDDRREAATARKAKVIAKKLAAYLPDVDVEPEAVWSGCFGESDTDLPTIGRPPGMKRSFAVLGYGGNGITFSAVAAELIQRVVIGLEDPDADLFAF